MGNNNRIKKLIERAVSLHQRAPLEEELIAKVEKKLNVKLPNDFKKISKEYDYGFFCCFEFFNFGREDEYSVIKETLDCRKNLGLPSRYVFLFEDDVSVVMWETKSSPEEKTPVIYCCIEDAYNLAEEKPLQYNPTIFASFTDFFAYLIEQEEEL